MTSSDKHGALNDGLLHLLCRSARTLFAMIAFINLAQANAKEIAVQGIGVSTCTQFANFYKVDAQSAENVFFAWAQGYLSGWNTAQIDAKQPTLNLALMDTKEQREFLRRYCDQHPLGNYIDAVDHLMFELQYKEATQSK